MNVFTTDHPMTSQPSYFDTKAHPLLSFICGVFVTTLMLAPLVFGYVVYAVATDDVQCTDEPDGPLFILGIPVSFVLSFICAFPLVLAYRLIAGNLRK
jgi:hypothetical protein